jgi:hypothetical protein
MTAQDRVVGKNLQKKRMGKGKQTPAAGSGLHLIFHKLEEINDRINTLDTGINGINKRIDGLDTAINKRINGIMLLTLLSMFFGVTLIFSNHDFGINRISVMEKITEQVRNGNELATSHAVYYNGSLMSLTVAHLGSVKNSTLCPGIDVMLLRTACPRFALNLGFNTRLRRGRATLFRFTFRLNNVSLF